MDITIDMEDYKLNVRTTAVIIHDNKILTHRNVNYDHYALLGGRVMIGEDSKNAIKREVFEELGKEIEIVDYIATIENFFEMKGSKYHEILFVYKAEFTDENDRNIKDTIKNIEGKEYLQYEWLELNALNEYPLVPNSIKNILIEGRFPIHKINDELKE